MSQKKRNVFMFMFFIACCILILSLYMVKTNDYYNTKYCNLIDDYYKGYTNEKAPKGTIEDKLSELTSKAFIRGNQAGKIEINKND